MKPYLHPYLIQRIESPRSPVLELPTGLAAKYQADQERTPEERAYINGLFPLDYMGSAEFEFGEFGKTLREIVNQHADFIRFELTVSGSANNSWHKDLVVPAREVTLYGFCHKDHRTEAKRDIALFAIDKFEGHTKERVGLREVFGKVKATHYRDGRRLRKPITSLVKSDLAAWLNLENGWMVGTDKGQIDCVAELLGVQS